MGQDCRSCWKEAISTNMWFVLMDLAVLRSAIGNSSVSWNCTNPLLRAPAACYYRDTRISIDQISIRASMFNTYLSCPSSWDCDFMCQAPWHHFCACPHHPGSRGSSSWPFGAFSHSSTLTNGHTGTYETGSLRTHAPATPSRPRRALKKPACCNPQEWALSGLLPSHHLAVVWFLFHS